MGNRATTVRGVGAHVELHRVLCTMASCAAAKLFPAALAGAAGFGYYNVTYKRPARQYEFEPGCAPDEALSPQPWIHHVMVC